MMTSNRILPFLIFVTLISSMKCFVLQLQYNNSFELSKPGNDLSNEIAASQSTCRDDTQCAYGGICKDFGNRKNCVCKEGLEGDFCQVVIDCVRGKYRNCRGEKGTCLYTTRYEQAICACTEYQVLDEENNICKEVRCEKRSCHGGTCRVIGGVEICTCPPRYYLQEDTCIEMNKCEDGSHTCPEDSTECVAIGKKDFYCKCKAGYKLDNGNQENNKAGCRKLNKCEDGSHTCSEFSTRCIPMGEDDYRCDCNPGYKLKEGNTQQDNKDACIKLNKCEDGSHTCPGFSTRCIPVGEDDYICDCNPGYKLKEGKTKQHNKDACIKLNKCEDGSHTCSEFSTRCIPMGEDDYRCDCNHGYKLKEGNTQQDNKDACIKMDKCESGSHTCPGDSTACVAVGDYDYVCECNYGYKLKEGKTRDTNKDGCIKMNRCERGSHTCPGDSTTCVAKGFYDYHCECKEGYKLEAGSTKENNKVGCIKMNRCERGSHTCPGDSTWCVAKGYDDYYCECKDGYKLEAGSTKENNKIGCIKMNRCEWGGHTCPGDSTTCVAVGDYDYVCECNYGYKLKEGKTKDTNKDGCIEMNRCEKGSHTCPKNSTACVALGDYDYVCECNYGYKLKEGKTRDTNKDGCIKMNRCEDGSHTCPGVSTKCVAVGDDYYCECKKGYKLENRSMKENKAGCIECDCGKNGDCAVVKGQKKCKCNEKYAAKDGICQVCDCGEGSTCSFIRGAKACNCLRGYEFDAEVGKCREKNYCDPDPCVHGYCAKTGYDFVCICENPFIGRFCEISTCIETECLGGKCQIVGDKEYCICPKGYILESGVCRKSCENITCFDGKCVILDDVETCICPPDHVLEGDFCRKTKCSNDSCIGGICEVLKNNVEDCTCPIGFTLTDKECKRSKCVPGICYGGRCEKQENGDLVCVCPRGYRLEDIGCKAIVCTKRNCFGGVCEVVDGEEICTCHDGYFLKDDICERQ